ncbi:MAG: zinc ribbon domain-containing protein [Firmicutes bacterium]|nr:zinc ribbon domain-containing protein [Bacillota bacterium]
MRCPYCGNDVPDEFRFCSRCGNQLPPPMIVDPEPPKKKKTGLIIGLSIGGVILIAAIVLAVLSLTGKIDLFSFLQKAPEIETVRVNLNNYLSADFSGFDGQGTCAVTFDEESFVKDFAGKIVNTEEFLEEWKANKSKDAEESKAPEDKWVKALLKEISFDASPLTDLKNSDTVTITWNCKPKELEEKYNIRLVSSDTVFTVEGLSSIIAIDPFEKVVVTFEGISPNVTASFDLSGVDEALKKTVYHPDKTANLKNGDIITVTIEDYDEEAMKAAYGKILSTTTKEYVVDVPSSYVADASELAGLDYSALDIAAETYFNDYREDIALTNFTVDSFTRTSSYLMTYAGDPTYISSISVNNVLLVFYEVILSTEHTPYVHSDYQGTYSAGSLTYRYRLYYPVYINNLTVTNGSLDVPVESISSYTNPDTFFSIGYVCTGTENEDILLQCITGPNPNYRTIDLATGEVLEATSTDAYDFSMPDDVDYYSTLPTIPPDAAAITLPSVNTALPDSTYFSAGTADLAFHGYTITYPTVALTLPAEVFTNTDVDVMYYWDDMVLFGISYVSFDLATIADRHSEIRDWAIDSLVGGDGISFDIYQYQEVTNPNGVRMDIARVKVQGNSNYPEEGGTFAFIYDDSNKSLVVVYIAVMSPSDDTLEYSADFAAILNSIKK